MSKTIIYQILPRLWGNRKGKNITSGNLSQNGSGKFSDIDSQTLDYLKGLGVSHLWLTGVVRHATTESFEGCPPSNPRIVKGRAGSPYSIVDYYDVNPYLADNQSSRMDEFESLIDRIHSAGLKALIDFIPNHLSRDYGKTGLVRPEIQAFGALDDSSVHWKEENDFFYYPGQSLVLPAAPGETAPEYLEFPAKASGNSFSPYPAVSDWYETVKLNYCDFHTGTWDKILGILLYWCAKGVDGFRCDMVELVPQSFFKWLIAKVKDRFPKTIFVAETYNRSSYSTYIRETGFDLLYDKSGTYDEIRSLVQGQGTAENLTRNWQFLGDLQPKMLNFLENHDEQRFASDFFGKDPANSEAALAFSLLFNTSAYLIYSGEEAGERGMDQEGFSGLDGRTTIFDWWRVESLQRIYEYAHTGKGLLPEEQETFEKYSHFLNTAAGNEAFSDGGTYDLCYCNRTSPGFNPKRHFAFLRGNSDSVYLVVCNFSGSDASISVRIPPEALSYFGNIQNHLSPDSSDTEISAANQKGAVLPDHPLKVKAHCCAIVKL